MFIFCLNLFAFSNSHLTKEDGKNNETTALLPLPEGIYYMCCQNGRLNLYDLIGTLVGSGSTI